MRTVSALALLLVASCAGSGSEVPANLTKLDAGVDPLQEAFDAATGKVRAIVLASPT